MADMFDGITKVMYGSTEMNLVKTVSGSTTYYSYVKAFTYSTGSKTGVSNIVCTRASSPYKGAATGTVANGGTLYYGDTFYITCGSATGYTASSSLSASSTATVSSNITGSSYTSATINKYTLKINKGTGIAKIYYKTGTSSNAYTESTNNVSVDLNYGTEYWWYATASTGYTYTATSSSSPGNGTIGTSNVTLTPTATINSYAVNITAGTGVKAVYTSTTYGATSGNASGTKYNYGSTVYAYATLADNTSSYTYTKPNNDWEQVGSSRTYIVGSHVMGTAAHNFGTFNATRTAVTPTYTFHIMYSYSGMIAPYYICANESEFNGMKAIGYERILTTTVTTAATSYKMTSNIISNLIETATGGFNFYDGGDITFTLNSSKRDIYLAAHIND